MSESLYVQIHSNMGILDSFRHLLTGEVAYRVVEEVENHCKARSSSNTASDPLHCFTSLASQQASSDQVLSFVDELSSRWRYHLIKLSGAGMHNEVPMPLVTNQLSGKTQTDHAAFFTDTCSLNAGYNVLISEMADIAVKSENLQDFGQHLRYNNASLNHYEMFDESFGAPAKFLKAPNCKMNKSECAFLSYQFEYNFSKNRVGVVEATQSVNFPENIKAGDAKPQSCLNHLNIEGILDESCVCSDEHVRCLGFPFLGLHLQVCLMGHSSFSPEPPSEESWTNARVVQLIHATNLLRTHSSSESGSNHVKSKRLVGVLIRLTSSGREVTAKWPSSALRHIPLSVAPCNVAEWTRSSEVNVQPNSVSFDNTLTLASLIRDALGDDGDDGDDSPPQSDIESGSDGDAEHLQTGNPARIRINDLQYSTKAEDAENDFTEDITYEGEEDTGYCLEDSFWREYCLNYRQMVGSRLLANMDASSLMKLQAMVNLVSKGIQSEFLVCSAQEAAADISAFWRQCSLSRNDRQLLTMRVKEAEDHWNSVSDMGNDALNLPVEPRLLLISVDGKLIHDTSNSSSSEHLVVGINGALNAEHYATAPKLSEEELQ